MNLSAIFDLLLQLYPDIFSYLIVKSEARHQITPLFEIHQLGESIDSQNREKVLDSIFTLLEYVSQSACIDSFISNGGVILLRVVMGMEIGLLSSIDSFLHGMTNDNATLQIRPNQNRQILVLLLFQTIEKCAVNEYGLKLLVSTGLSVILSDIFLVLQSATELERKLFSAHSVQKQSSSLLFDDVRGSISNLMSNAVNNEDSSASLYKDFNRHVNMMGHVTKVNAASCPTLVACLLPSVLFSLSQVVCVANTESNSIESEAFSHSINCVDSFIWYMFVTNLFGNLVHSVQMIESDAAQKEGEEISTDLSKAMRNSIVFQGVALIESVFRFLRFFIVHYVLSVFQFFAFT